MHTLAFSGIPHRHQRRAALKQQNPAPRRHSSAPITLAPPAAANSGSTWFSHGAGLTAVILIHLAAASWFNQPEQIEPANEAPRPLEIELARPLPQIQPAVPLPAQVRAPAIVPQSVQIQQAPAPVIQQTAPVAEAAPATANEVSRPAAPIVAVAAPAPVAAPVETPPIGKMGYLNNPAPSYPESALDRGLEGTTLLKVRVLANGHAQSVEIQQSSGWKILDEAALRTVRQWLFVPAKRGDQALDGWATVPIVFKLGK